MTTQVQVGRRVRVARALDSTGEAFVGSVGIVVAHAPEHYEEDWEVVLDGDGMATFFFDGELEVA